MSGVGLVGKASVVYSHEAVQDAHLVLSGESFSDSTTNLDFEMFGEGLLKPVQVLVEPESGEIISMDHTTQVAVLVSEATGGC